VWWYCCRLKFCVVHYLRKCCCSLQWSHMRILWWLQLNHREPNKNKNFVALHQQTKSSSCGRQMLYPLTKWLSWFPFSVYRQRSNRYRLNLIVQKYRRFVLGNSLAFVLSCWNKHANFVLSAVFQNFLSRNFVLATLSPIEYTSIL